jgi:hypothetical protein
VQAFLSYTFFTSKILHLQSSVFAFFFLKDLLYTNYLKSVLFLFLIFYFFLIFQVDYVLKHTMSDALNLLITIYACTYYACVYISFSYYQVQDVSHVDTP